MYDEHLKNRQKRNVSRKGNRMEYAVVEGAGPNGLFAVFQLFLAGMKVRLVNDRPEEYMRSRIFLLDPKWMCQLRFYLGK